MKLSVHMVVSGVFLIGVDNPGTIQSIWNKVIKIASTYVIWAWWRHIIPRHFRPGARTQYPDTFFTRKRVTQRRKFRKFGHSDPLVVHAYGQPPEDNRRTFEEMLAVPPIIGGTSRRRWGQWRTPRVTSVYKDEASSLNRADQKALGKVFNDTAMQLLTTGIVRSQDGLSEAANLRRIARVKFV